MRKRFERFCFKHRDKGIPDLMLYFAIGSAVVYFAGGMGAGDMNLYSLLCFNRADILQGQIWRLFSYAFTYGYEDPNFLLVAIGLVCYYSIGKAMENVWGTFRFNLFYFCGILLQDIFCLVFGGEASIYSLNLSLLLSYATMYPHSEFRVLFIIPIKAWALGLFYLAMTIYNVWILSICYGFPYALYPLIAILNYFLFFGKDALNLLPISWRANAKRMFRSQPKTMPNRSAAKPKVVPFPTAGSYEASVATVKAPYTHKCTICGKTDASHPDLEFRYCSRCNGYHCYCQEHISNHTHVE